MVIIAISTKQFITLYLRYGCDIWQEWTRELCIHCVAVRVEEKIDKSPLTTNFEGSDGDQRHENFSITRLRSKHESSE